MRIEALQRHRINRVMNFARSCESDVLTLENLADVACLSRYHFSRMFAQYCNETPIGFVSRMRLEQSVSNLIYQLDMSITSIAFEAGFSISQAYSNAFSRRYGVSPRHFRTDNQWYIKKKLNKKNETHFNSGSPAILGQSTLKDSNVVLMTMPETRLAYLRYRGPYYGSCGGMRAVRKRLVEWAKLRGLWQDDTEIIGVCPDNDGVTPPLFCQYDQGIAVENGVVEDDLISIQILPEITLATIEGVDLWRDEWRWLLSDWLPRSGMKIASHTFYETLRLKADQGNRLNKLLTLQ